MIIAIWLKQLFCDHDYEYTRQNYYFDKGDIVYDRFYKCSKCGHEYADEYRTPYKGEQSE